MTRKSVAAIQNDVGMPRMLPWTRLEKVESRTPWRETFSVSTMSNPAATLRVARVTMKSLIFSRVTRVPFTKPKTRPVARPAAIPTTVGAPDLSAHNDVPALSPATVPIDRSIPPAVMTMATPTVMMRMGIALVM